MSRIYHPLGGAGHRLLALLGLAWAMAGIPLAAGEAVSFRNDVMAVLSKAGCNAGACHGNANGKAGFKLSLRGQDPGEDWAALARDQFARRINPIDPERSLILLKPAMELAHEGGKRFDRESMEYRVVREWIAQGAADDLSSAPRLTGLTVTPSERVLVEPANTVQLRVEAAFSDGAVRDVTRLAVYETANAPVTVTAEGLAVWERHGETTVLARFLDRQLPVRLAYLPARPEYVWRGPAPNNYVDEHIFAKLRRFRIDPSERCSDNVFIRRACLDLLGLLPSAEQARQFVADGRPDKRALLIEQLLQRPEFADHWALKWADLLRAEERTLDEKGLHNFHHWIRQNIAANRPLDAFARELLTARGSTYRSPAANFYRANRDAVTRAEAAAQVFLGVRLQCAQCHNHPFDRWTQSDYYQWGAVFAPVKYKILENRRRDSNDSHEFKGEQIVYVSGQGELKDPRTGRPAAPRLLAEERPLTDSADPLHVLGDWLADPGNPFFARAQVNRVWYHLMGRGLVDPIDDFRATNPASHPELLEELARDFVARRFDLRHLIRVIMNSRAYQLSSQPNETNVDDNINYSRALVRRLTAEQLLDAQHQVAGVETSFQGYPTGLRASQLPGARGERRRGQKADPLDQFLELFGKPARLLTCECERSTEPTMNQAFQMISGPSLHELLTRPDNRFGQLLAAENEDVIERLYWTALTRPPTPVEKERLIAYVHGSADRRRALEDLTWSLLNSKEFVLRF